MAPAVVRDDLLGQNRAGELDGTQQPAPSEASEVTLLLKSGPEEALPQEQQHTLEPSLEELVDARPEEQTWSPPQTQQGQRLPWRLVLSSAFRGSEDAAEIPTSVLRKLCLFSDTGVKAQAREVLQKVSKMESSRCCGFSCFQRKLSENTALSHFLMALANTSAEYTLARTAQPFSEARSIDPNLLTYQNYFSPRVGPDTKPIAVSEKTLIDFSGHWIRPLPSTENNLHGTSLSLEVIGIIRTGLYSGQDCIPNSPIAPSFNVASLECEDVTVRFLAYGCLCCLAKGLSLSTGPQTVTVREGPYTSRQ
ncbi:hypothetical protein UY3_02460 [Chelonia mydas]|uniref:Uncharacterized protein n=1 Tax=Chelonia mydas TaxID=8469 RepID=M7CHB3_CHEMY|nr:hypothetical protein UY3_02460 [Chelonia mydas]